MPVGCLFFPYPFRGRSDLCTMRNVWQIIVLIMANGAKGPRAEAWHACSHLLKELALERMPSVCKRAPTCFEAELLCFSRMYVGIKSAKPQICIIQAFAVALCFCSRKSVMGFLLASA